MENAIVGYVLQAGNVLEKMALELLNSPKWKIVLSDGETVGGLVAICWKLVPVKLGGTPESLANGSVGDTLERESGVNIIEIKLKMLEIRIIGETWETEMEITKTGIDEEMMEITKTVKVLEIGIGDV
ncbi:hypothetical protein SK128_022931 [Halocaridina rubra]|uniref:Uncharacterized protein n=1 Tax=Halocaridina rubra TaxID=373956 RepID=A0AAN8WH91_HALRR